MARSFEDYRKLLEKGLSSLPKKVVKSERLVLPELSCMIIGNRTFISNFKELCTGLNRELKHVLTYLVKEIGTAGSTDGVRAMLHGTFKKEAIKAVIDRYIRDYVTCPICSRPDTRIERERRIWFLVCEACGAKSSVRIMR